MKTSPSLAFFLSALVLATASPVLGASYSITDLGQGSASDLNDAGSVVGVNAQNGGWYYHGGTQSALTNVVVADLQGPGGEHNYVYTETFASLRINNAEQIAGVGFWPAVPDNVLSFLYVPQGGGGTGITYPGVGTGATGYGGSLALSDSGLAALSYFVDVLPLRSFSAAAQVIVPSPNGGTFDLGFPYEKINAINSSNVLVGSLALGPASFPGQKATYLYPARACIVTNYVVQF
ncbi:MAG TPA: hypothetical protein VMF06_12210, partial [Candidatus Limnocylindria bacterium]|nr:hypothetical protein [Candidatus Limnocylindria bacterium]